MDDAIIQAYARLTAHEFVLEVMMANWVAGMPEDAEKEFLDNFENMTRFAWSRDSFDASADQVLKDSIQISSMFIAKVRKRSAEIRAKR